MRESERKRENTNIQATWQLHLKCKETNCPTAPVWKHSSENRSIAHIQTISVWWKSLWITHLTCLISCGWVLISLGVWYSDYLYTGTTLHVGGDIHCWCSRQKLYHLDWSPGWCTSHHKFSFKLEAAMEVANCRLEVVRAAFGAWFHCGWLLWSLRSMSGMSWLDGYL